LEPEKRESLSEVAWQDLHEPGAYVEIGNGDLYGVPKEALLQGGSPVIEKQSEGASKLVRISKDPFITTFGARMLCAEHNLEPNF
jgi:hypothetical protein